MLIFKEPEEPPRVSSTTFLSGTGALLPDPSMLHSSSCKKLHQRIPSGHTACPRTARQGQGQELPRLSARTQTDAGSCCSASTAKLFPTVFLHWLLVPRAFPEQQLGWCCHVRGERGLEEHCAPSLAGKEFQETAEVWSLPGIWDWTEKSGTEIKSKSHQVTSAAIPLGSIKIA